MSSTVDTLGRDHEEVLAKLASVESGLAGGRDGDLPGFLSFLRNDLALHFTVEEQALFPVMGRHLSLSSGPLAVMNAEHDQFRQLVAALGAALDAADAERQRACAEDIIEMLRAHIAKEDNVLFPMASRMLSAAEQQDVDSMAARVKKGEV